MSINTTQLERFAAAARTRLMGAVGARLDMALSAGSPIRVDEPGAAGELQHQVDAQGRDALVEQYAYRWFNRIIALRYMDVMGFTGLPVVSPASMTDPNGTPEILAAAKRGEYDPDIFEAPGTGNGMLRKRIQALLDGGTGNPNAQADAYGLLIQAACRYWHQYMPFMFPDTNSPAGRVDELLMPPDLLAEGSVLRHAIEVMTPQACGADEPGGNVEIIGWLYQFYIAERKDEVMRGFGENLKATADTIPAATQLFTPDWIVRYLVQNSVGRLWMQNHPESTLADGWEYYIQPTEDADGDVLRIDSPEDLTVCDPACGSGHMLTYAFDLLIEIYEEQGYAPSEIPGLILEHNLFGMEIDERAADLAAFALTMKARAHSRRFFRKQVMPHICQIRKEEFTAGEVSQLNDIFDVTLTEGSWNTYAQADVTGSLIQPDAELAVLADNMPTEGTDDLMLDESLRERGDRVLEQTRYLDRQYAAVVANPPYMGSRNMGKGLREYVQEHYPDGKSNLFAVFMLLCLRLSALRGVLGMVTLRAWMSQSSYKNLRDLLLKTTTITTMADLGAGSFDSITGEVVSTTAFTLLKTASNTRGAYLRLVDVRGDEKQAQAVVNTAKIHQPYRYTVSQQRFEQIPGSPIVYWLPDFLLSTFKEGKPLEEVSQPRQGLATANNDRFMREWWEVAQRNTAFGCTSRQEAQGTGATWFPYNKGGLSRKWYGNQEFVVNWRNDGEEVQAFRPRSVIRNPRFYFQPSVSWSDISSNGPSFRYFPAGFIFDVKGMSIFNKRSQSILSVLNSSVGNALLSSIATNIYFQVGDVAKFPFVESDYNVSLIENLINIAKQDWDSYETSWDFTSFPLFSMDTALPLEQLVTDFRAHWDQVSEEQRQREIRNNEIVADAYGVRDDVPCDVSIERVSLKRNKAFVYPKDSEEERNRKFMVDTVKELISYAVGCMFGRYSLDKPGLILASQGETLEDYRRRAPEPSFEPDADNVIPLCGDGYFEDDITSRFRVFLAAAFGSGNLERNLAFIEETLGKSVRDYFVKDFYDDHVRMYSNRPIYWQYSSRTDNKGAFKALVYVHRYTPSTTNKVLEYLRDYTTHLQRQAELLDQSDRAADKRRAERLRKAVSECRAYEDQVLYPLAARNLPMDLDDGVAVNYLRMGQAVCKITSIEGIRKKIRKKPADWTWPHYPVMV